jgi:hypothetical protein
MGANAEAPATSKAEQIKRMDFSPVGDRSLTERYEEKHGKVGGQAEMPLRFQCRKAMVGDNHANRAERRAVL